MTRKFFAADLNWSIYQDPFRVIASSPQDWMDLNVDEYVEWHKYEMGCNCASMQCIPFAGYALYPSRLAPLAPGEGSRVFPRFYEKARKEKMEVWSYMCVGVDVFTSNVRQDWLVPTSRDHINYGALGPETPWTDLLCARIREFLSVYPVDGMLFDWFCYGSLKPNDFMVQPVWFAEKPFREIIGRPMPDKAGEITQEEGMKYKREVLARQFTAIKKAVKETSGETKLMFNVPYWEPYEKIWEGHIMMEESDILLAESSDDVVGWLLEVKKPWQKVMTTVIGRLDGVCDPTTWRKWHDLGCDLLGYAFGTPPSFYPLSSYDGELAIVKQAFREIKDL